MEGLAAKEITTEMKNVGEKERKEIYFSQKRKSNLRSSSLLLLLLLAPIQYFSGQSMLPTNGKCSSQCKYFKVANIKLVTGD